MEGFVFRSPVKAHFGFGAMEEIKGILEPYKSVGVVSGKTAIEKTGFRSFLEETFSGSKNLSFYSQVEENPSINTIIRGGKFMRESKCDVILAFGGGSPLDAAKSIAAFATNHEGFYDLHYKKELPKPPLPVLAVPTTCGTGSEMNAYSIITDTEKLDKINFSKEGMFPKWAVLDPGLLRTLDEKTLLATVFDAFTHAMEGFISTKANPFSDMAAMTSMELIASTLASTDDLTSDDALMNFMYASSLAGVVILHTGTTLLHALGYYLTNRKGIHHGTANAMLLEGYMQMLSDKSVQKFGVVPAVFSKHGFDMQKWLDRLGAESLDNTLSDDEKLEMVKYALAKPNTKLTPFTADEDFVLERLG
ncbi:iron-containing alcohol dehydrogenase [Limisalsivibrio acetivorans]|uniref:iron-containing alcohol dehydrogenase n=1 Tax=Limisalsivibrio acetivorans TaxID=1304888 RepID=UPI0003B64DE5|nr:iron-containing alcohol dehydrogenase [Limisalsivibrio acetivorans]